MNCRVIATYFGPRRNHNNANKSILNYNDTIDLLKDTLALEKSLSSGVEKDTIIVNHDFGNKEGKDFLDKADGMKTADGKIRIFSFS